MEKAKILYEEIMSRVICPQDYKSFSIENLGWVKSQLSDRRINDYTLVIKLTHMVNRCEEFISLGHKNH